MDSELESIASAIEELRSFTADISHSLESDDGTIADAAVRLADATTRVADAIKSPHKGSDDDAGVYVESLTEAVMGVTSGLCQIASAIRELAEAVREKGE